MDKIDHSIAYKPVVGVAELDSESVFGYQL